MFKRFVYQGLPVSVLLILLAAAQGVVMRAFAVEAAPRASVEWVR